MKRLEQLLDRRFPAAQLGVDGFPRPVEQDRARLVQRIRAQGLERFPQPIARVVDEAPLLLQIAALGLPAFLGSRALGAFTVERGAEIGDFELTVGQLLAELLLQGFERGDACRARVMVSPCPRQALLREEPCDRATDREADEIEEQLGHSGTSRERSARRRGMGSTVAVDTAPLTPASYAREPSGGRRRGDRTAHTRPRRDDPGSLRTCACDRGRSRTSRGPAGRARAGVR